MAKIKLIQGKASLAVPVVIKFNLFHNRKQFVVSKDKTA